MLSDTPLLICLSVGAIPMAAVAGAGFRGLIDWASGRFGRSLVRLGIGVAAVALILLYAVIPPPECTARCRSHGRRTHGSVQGGVIFSSAMEGGSNGPDALR